jgi:predicted alpha/beta superfamily hydrolase
MLAAGVKRPLLVMFDGQNIFGHHGSFAGGWHVHDAVAKFAQTRRPPAPIVVGIAHGGLARIDELSPFSDGKRGGKLDALVGTIVDELLPRAHSRFDLGYGPGSHFIGGSSLGGLASLYAHFQRPEVFGGCMAMSPSLWFTRVRFAQWVAAQSVPLRSRVYLDMGPFEGNGKSLPLTEAFAERLRVRGWGEPSERGDLRVMMRPDMRGRHDEKAWRRRFPKALAFLMAT